MDITVDENVQLVELGVVFSVVESLGKLFSYCVVSENIHTPTTEGIGNSRGVGGSKSQEIPEGMGGKRRNFRPEGRKSIDFLRMSIGATYLL